jgi:hypothetical protein
MRPSQLAKQPGHELAPTGKTSRVALGYVLLNSSFEIPARKQLQHLRENAAYSHLSLLRLNWFLCGTQSQPIRSSAFPLARSSALNHSVSPLIRTAVVVHQGLPDGFSGFGSIL